MQCEHGGISGTSVLSSSCEDMLSVDMLLESLSSHSSHKVCLPCKNQEGSVRAENIADLVFRGSKGTEDRIFNFNKEFKIKLQNTFSTRVPCKIIYNNGFVLMLCAIPLLFYQNK